MVPEFTLSVSFGWFLKKNCSRVSVFDEWLSLPLREKPDIGNCGSQKGGLLTNLHSKENQA